MIVDKLFKLKEHFEHTREAPTHTGPNNDTGNHHGFGRLFWQYPPNLIEPLHLSPLPIHRKRHALPINPNQLRMRKPKLNIAFINTCIQRFHIKVNSVDGLALGSYCVGDGGGGVVHGDEQVLLDG